MRNLTDEQADVLAWDLVRSHLEEGLPDSTIGEYVNEFLFDLDPEGEATSSDIEAVTRRVSEELRAVLQQWDTR